MNVELLQQAFVSSYKKLLSLTENREEEEGSVAKPKAWKALSENY
jgi:hypothetical protein